MPAYNCYRLIGQKLFLAVLTSGFNCLLYAQLPTSNAANWKLWILDSPQEISVPAPPDLATTQKELKELKQRMGKQDQQTIMQIKYWDAGAPAYRWNQMAPTFINLQNFILFVRSPSSWMNVAIYDATVLAWKAKKKYQRKRPAQSDPTLKTVVKAPPTSSYPCEHSTTAAAAALVLAYFYPDKADSIVKLARAAAQSRIDAGVQYPSDVEAGWKLGEQVAKEIIEHAKNDGSAVAWTGTMRTDPKGWTGSYPVGITVASFKPMMLKSGDQFRPPPPPDFATEMQEMKNFKQNARTVTLAHYWHSLSGFEFWTDLASQKIFEYRLSDDAPAAARIYAVLHSSLRDASIAIMDAKYAYWGIRPFQYDSTYKPLLQTPPFPGYPSGHATASSVACTVLRHFFPADAAIFNQKAQECADSRFYGGIHFRTDNETGLKLGKQLANYFINAWGQEN